jgi:hypothetical protein
MATENEGKNPHGRTYEQLTRDGTSSVGSMGAGGTGKIGNEQAATPGAAQGGPAGTGAGRTDDLLSSDADGEAQGFTGNSQGGERQAAKGVKKGS